MLLYVVLACGRDGEGNKNEKPKSMAKFNSYNESQRDALFLTFI